MGGYAVLKAHLFFRERDNMPKFDWEKFSARGTLAMPTPDSVADPPMRTKKAKNEKHSAAAGTPSNISKSKPKLPFAMQ